MFNCLVSAKYNMTATLLTQGPTAPSTNPDDQGHWENKQDEVTGEIIRVWVVDDADPDTAGTQERRIPCMVRGVIDGGIRVAGTTERYTPQGVYDNVDYAKMSFPANIVITKRDRVTNITGPDGTIIWKEEEWTNAPTVFEVMGVTPIPDPFGNLIENIALLKRAEVQQYGS